LPPVPTVGQEVQRRRLVLRRRDGAIGGGGLSGCPSGFRFLHWPPCGRAGPASWRAPLDRLLRRPRKGATGAGGHQTRCRWAPRSQERARRARSTALGAPWWPRRPTEPNGGPRGSRPW